MVEKLQPWMEGDPGGTVPDGELVVSTVTVSSSVSIKEGIEGENGISGVSVGETTDERQLVRVFLSEGIVFLIVKLDLFDINWQLEDKELLVQ